MEIVEKMVQYKVYLNLLKIPYTHSGVATSAIAMNKIFLKEYCN